MVLGARQDYIVTVFRTVTILKRTLWEAAVYGKAVAVSNSDNDKILISTCRYLLMGSFL